MRNLFTIVPVALMFILVASGYSQPTPLALPTPQQLAFQDFELGVFIHYSIDAYAERGILSGSTPASAFNPTALNTEQWILAAKAMGANYVVLTARHEQGFCLWPTKTTDYSIKSSPYKNGKGDIVKEFEPVTASAIRFSVSGSLVKPAVMRSIAIFNYSGLSVKK